MCCTHGWIRGWRMIEGGKAERRKGGRPLGINPCPRRYHLGFSFALVLSPFRPFAFPPFRWEGREKNVRMSGPNGSTGGNGMAQDGMRRSAAEGQTGRTE